MTADPNTHAPSNSAAEGRIRRVELLISNVLRTGVIVSLTLIVIGTLLSVVHHPEYVSSSAELQRLTQPGAAFPHTLRDVLSSVLHLRGQGIVTLGLLTLIATPVLRVGMSIVAFFHEGDRRIALISGIVLCLLLLSFVIGGVG
jgi:uncharacterized membrane protein